MSRVTLTYKLATSFQKVVILDHCPIISEPFPLTSCDRQQLDTNIWVSLGFDETKLAVNLPQLSKIKYQHEYFQETPQSQSLDDGRDFRGIFRA